MRWDAPDHYGVACKRADCRTRKSAYNLRRQAGTALADLIERARAPLARGLVLERGLPPARTRSRRSSRERGHVGAVAVPRPRYVGARIGIHDPSGRRVGTVSHLSNTEHLFVCGPDRRRSTARCCRFRARSFVMMEPAGIRPPAELRRDDMPQYMLLIYDEEAQRANATEADMARVMQEYFAFTDDLTQRGAMKDGAPLDPISTARTVRVRDGQALVVDGPFAETKEQLGGFYMVECDTIDQAVEAAKMCPGAKYGSVEVRPVMQIAARV